MDMKRLSHRFTAFLAALFIAMGTLLAALAALAESYPDMVGVWAGTVRTVSSGSGQVARGGAVISEIDLKVTIHHQDGETFVGQSRSSQMSRDDPSVPVWGAIRSNGDEALFIGGNGGRGQLWFVGPEKFEYCLTNMQEQVMTAYCGVLEKLNSADPSG